MEHHRFFVDAQAPGGQTLRLFTDTGGCMNLTTRGADKLGLAYDKENNLGSEHEPVFGTTTWPTYASPWIPPPKAADVRLAIMPRSEEHPSELQSLMRLSYAVLRLTNK